GSEFRSMRDFQGHALIGECSFGADNALRDGRLRREESAGDFVGREAAEQAKRESHAGLGGKYRVTRYEDEAQQVVANIIVERGFQIWHGHLLLRLKFPTQLRVLEFEALVSSPEIDGTILRGSHKPRAWISRNSGLRPLLEGSDESVLSEFLGKPDVADDSRKACDDSGRLDSPDRVDDAMYVGSRHGYPSHHLQSGGASPGCRDSSSRYFSRLSSTNKRSYALQSKASGPSTWRTSVSPSQPGQYFLCSSMKRLAPSIASSFDFNSKIANPPTTSLASAKGPSTAFTCPRESRTRALFAIGDRPPHAIIVPDFSASSPSFAIASRNSLGG